MLKFIFPLTPIACGFNNHLFVRMVDIFNYSSCMNHLDLIHEMFWQCPDNFKQIIKFMQNQTLWEMLQDAPIKLWSGLLAGSHIIKKNWLSNIILSGSIKF